uniref:Leucine-binding protein domain-containing protein n=1 Tax=Comamonas testosteroni TaxID=285 RepID=G9C9E8_COMTE|nr:ABC transporter substrate-binding protein [Comamonas testosteroni]AEX00413.1 hypothetical protein [Comamonas testosteroni]
MDIKPFRDEFGRIPTQFAAQAYDVIMGMDAAVKSVNGKVADREALLAALRSAKFDSVRGPFKYNVNNYPIQNFYVRTVVKDPQNGLTNKLQSTILENHADAFVSQCSMK